MPLLVIVRFPGAALLILVFVLPLKGSDLIILNCVCGTLAFFQRKGGAVASLITGALMQNPAARRIILDMIYNHWRKSDCFSNGGFPLYNFLLVCRTARKVEQEKIRKRNLRKKRGT